MHQVRVVTPAADDDEVAACMAVINSLLQEEQLIDNGQVAKQKMSGWKLASMLEATGRAARISNRSGLNIASNAWSSGGKAKVFGVLVTAISLSLAALASASAADGGYPQAQLRPPLPGPGYEEADNTVQPSRTNWRPSSAPQRVVSDVMPPLAPPISRNPDAGAMNGPSAGGAGAAPASAGQVPNANDGTSDTNDLSDADQPYTPHLVRVLLSANRNDTTLSLPDGGVLKDVRTGDTLAEFPPQSRWQIALRAPGGLTQLSFSGVYGNARDSRVFIASRNEYRNVAFTPGTAPRMSMVPIPPSVSPHFWLPATRTADGQQSGRAYMLVPPDDGAFSLNGKLYRGMAIINPRTSGAFDVVNYVDIEDYLQSVVPSEMPSGWPLEALKAQAVAARSYAMSNIGKHDADDYDLKPNTEDQVYTGVASESNMSNRAVAETRGQVLRYQGKVVTAYFHSSSGGYTETAENVWSRNLPYLKAVPDYDDESPHFNWNRSCATSTAEQALAKSGKSVGGLLNLTAISRGASPRVRWLLVSGTDRSVLISGEEARKIFSLPSTNFNVGGSGGSYVFAGRGWGHGLGMSQWGAKRLAEAGFNYSDILNYYYKDVSVERL